MSLIIYAKDLNGPEVRLQAVFKSLTAEEETETFHSLEGLQQRLLSMPYEDAVVVLTAAKREELSELLPILPLFRKVRIVLILPDQEPETIKIGYKLEPRFLGYFDSCLTELRAVIKQMLTHLRPLPRVESSR